MMGWFGKNLSPIGLDLGSHSIKAVQLRQAGKAWSESASVCLDRANPNSVITADEILRLVDVLDRRGFIGREVVMAVPADKLMTSVLELPPKAPGVPIEEIAKVEFARINKQEPSALTISTWDLPAAARASKASTVMAIGYVSALAETFLKPLDEAGLHVTALDEQTSAKARACIASDAPAGMTAILDLGHRAATLSVVKNRTIVYGRSNFEAGLSRLRDAMDKASLDNPDLVQLTLSQIGLTAAPEAESNDIAELRDLIIAHLNHLADECRSAVSYSAHKYPDSPVGMLLLVGGGTMVPGVAEHLETNLGLMTRIAKTAVVPNLSSAVLMQAAGLAMFAAA